MYYLSQVLVNTREKYSPIEKVYLALIFAIQKLFEYLQHHHKKLISKADPLKPILNRLPSTGV